MLARLPGEIVDQVIRDVDEFPIGVEEAREIRGRLMEERKAFEKEWEDDLLYPDVILCMLWDG